MGDEGDVVDEQLWAQDEDKPQQSKAEEKYEKDAPVQVVPATFPPEMLSPNVVSEAAVSQLK